MAASEVLWLRSILTELVVLPLSIPTIYCDNQSATTLGNNPKFQSRTKHIKLDIHLLREKVANKSIQIHYVSGYD